jgi:hypothetical protein
MAKVHELAKEDLLWLRQRDAELNGREQTPAEFAAELTAMVETLLGPHYELKIVDKPGLVTERRKKRENGKS